MYRSWSAPTAPTTGSLHEKYANRALKQYLTHSKNTKGSRVNRTSLSPKRLSLRSLYEREKKISQIFNQSNCGRPNCRQQYYTWPPWKSPLPSPWLSRAGYVCSQFWWSFKHEEKSRFLFCHEKVTHSTFPADFPFVLPWASVPWRFVQYTVL